MKKHKDTLFRMLFSSRENLLSLYNAVNGTHYTDHPELELLVRILNINLNKNPEILDACQTLKEYMLLVERIRRYTKNMPLNEAVETAVNECIEENILVDFLQKNKSEAIAMCLFEYDDEREKKLIRKAEFQEGVKAGLAQGRAEGLNEGRNERTSKMLHAIRLIQQKHSLQDIHAKTGLETETIQAILKDLQNIQ